MVAASRTAPATPTSIENGNRYLLCPSRVFSSTKHTITDQRCSLKIEAIELLESWFRIGIFTQEDLHSVITLQERDRDYIDDSKGEL